MTMVMITLVFISIGFCLYSLSCVSDIDALKKQRDLLNAENLQLKSINTILRERLLKVDLEKMYKEDRRATNLYKNFSIEENETLKKALKKIKDKDPWYDFFD